MVWNCGAFKVLVWGRARARARALAAALTLKVAQAAFSERAPWVVRARVECASFGCLCRRLSPRMCGLLREVSLRATSPAAAAQMGGRGGGSSGAGRWLSGRAWVEFL